MEILTLPVANLEYLWLYIALVKCCQVLMVRIWDRIVKSCKTVAAHVLFIFARLESKYFSGKVFPLSLIGIFI